MKANTWAMTILGGLCCVVWLAGAEGAQAPARPGRALAIGITGAAEYQSAGGQRWRELKVAMVLPQGCTVRTAPDSSVDLALTTGAIVRLGPNTELRLEKLSEATRGLPSAGKVRIRQTHLALERGLILNRVRPLAAPSEFDGSTTPQSSHYQVAVAGGVAEAVGTEFLVLREANRILLRAVKQQLVFHWGTRVITLREGEEVSIAIDPGTGQLADTQPELTLGSADDWLAVHFDKFRQSTASVEGAVFGQEDIDVQTVLALAAAGEAAPTLPRVIVVGNPAVETSTSSP